MTKSGKSTVSFAFLGKIYRFFDEIRRMKDRCFGPEFLSLKAASCLSEFTQTWREKPAKPLRLRVLFRQIAQTWRENQARWNLGRAFRGQSGTSWLNRTPEPGYMPTIPSHTKAPPGFSPKENPAHPGCTGCSYLAAKKSLERARSLSQS